MLLNIHKIFTLAVIFVFTSCFCNVWADEEPANILAEITENTKPETLVVEVQGHENTSGRKVRQFGFSPFGFGGGYRPFPPGPGFYGPPIRGGGFSGGGFQRSRVVTRTQTRIVDRYQGGGFRGGFYG